MRVHALAKLLGVTSKQVVAQLAEMGKDVRSVQSSVVREDAETVATALGSDAPEALGTAAAPEALDAVAEEQAVGSTADESPASPTEPDLFTSAPDTAAPEESAAETAAPAPADVPLFLQPEPAPEAPRRRRASTRKAAPAAPAAEPEATDDATQQDTARQDAARQDTAQQDTAQQEPTGSDDADRNDTADDDSESGSGSRRRRRGRRGRGRGRGDAGDSTEDATGSDENDTDGSATADSADRTDSDENTVDRNTDEDTDENTADASTADENDSDAPKRSGRRRSRRGGQRNARSADESSGDSTGTDSDGESEQATGTPDTSAAEAATESDEAADGTDESGDGEDTGGESASRRRRRRRRRKSGGGDGDDTTSEDDPPNTVVHEREPRQRAKKDEVQGITGSTRLEAKRQRRRDGRDAGRRRPPILTESEFLARRESVDRTMVVREKSLAGHPDLTQVGVLEDGVLVEHFVTSTSSGSIVGNIYLGRVQNVLPSMEAAFIDIGKGRNGVLYAGEVDWDAAGLGGNSRKIEQALKSGDQVLVQVSKDPVGHKGARLTTQISLAGRFLVYVPGGSSTGISRKLPDNERKRLKDILRDIVPADAGVIIRTASEGVSAEELERDVTRLQAQWATIQERSSKAESSKGSSPVTLYEEPDLLVKVVRDLFNEDFSGLVIEGERAWSTVQSYIEAVAPDMLPKVTRYESTSKDVDVFAAYRIDEQLAKALDRKVWLPSGGTLVIDRTEAMTVVDVNTGKFTGEGGNLEETVTRNNLEAAEEVVRQMRLRDIGGMIVVDFIDMVLESNRDLVLRRLTEALGRDRTRHQVSEVTSLGLVQMTRKRMGTGLIEAFSTTCEHCHGRGIVVHQFPVEAAKDDGRGARGDQQGGSRRKRGGRSGDRDKSADTEIETTGDAESGGASESAASVTSGTSGTSGTSEAKVAPRQPHPVALAMAAHHQADAEVAGDPVAETGDPVADAEAAVEAVRAASTVDTVAESEPASDTPAASTPPAQPDAPAASTQPDAPAEPTPPATRPRRARRVARAASAPAGESAGTVIVVPAQSASESPSSNGSASESSDAPASPNSGTPSSGTPSSGTPESETAKSETPDAQPGTDASVTTGGAASASAATPVRRPRRRAAGRPAGPPVEE
ncbi:translation initiation factor IF-2 N-terminal domain-containing protein [Rhodococcus corynebacterioides]|uniref:Translation initiation factor IF-2 N-terminal domain-containing protein n=1 Tax=Rhodococcoides corynebacterioides TaxID=53972 RepID=A0ABS7P8S6_9NOCA|nr:translation initiation factor IF-2 N-terminal domain-containing protein [Rhodococcus corynebacterioides]MBY6409193.1 translation initiation factor IF-2 N-terminal domain-containing protein [Rhodococcus corynebacterioides]